MKFWRIDSDSRILVLSVVVLSCIALVTAANAGGYKKNQKRTDTLIEYRVVGYTAPTDGAIETADASLTGVAAMHFLCAKRYPNARASLSGEAIESPALRRAPATAWVISDGTEVIFVPDATQQTNDWITIDRSSGVATTKYGFGNPGSAISGALCESYQSNSNIRSGLAVETRSGRIFKGNCENSIPISCSAPFRVPVSR